MAEQIGRGPMSNDPNTCLERFDKRNPQIIEKKTINIPFAEKVTYYIQGLLGYFFRLKNLFPLPIPDCYTKEIIEPRFFIDSKGTEIEALLTDRVKPKFSDHDKVVQPDIVGYYINGQPVYK